MKPQFWLGCLLVSLTPALGLGADISLRGIVRFSNQEQALLEVSPAPSWRTHMILSAGQRDGDIELLEVDAAGGRVKVRVLGETREIAFPAELPANAWIARGGSGKPAGYLRLQQAASDAVFSLYQSLAQRSLIRSQAIAAFRLDVGCSNAANGGDLLKALEQALAAREILFKPDGEKFVLAGRKPDFDRVKPALWDLAVTLGKALTNTPTATTPTATTPTATGEGILPAGAINFPGTDLNQVLQILQELVNRTVIRTAFLPGQVVAFQSFTPLTRTEAIYAFLATLSINGSSVVPAGDKFICVFPTSDSAWAEKALARKPVAHPRGAGESLPLDAVNFSGGTPSQLAAFYSSLAGEPVVADPGLPRVTVWFRGQTVLSREEALRGLELLLALNRVAVVPQGEGKGLKFVPAAE